MSVTKTTNNPYKQGLAKTISQGLRTIGGSSSVYYTLYYLDNSAFKRASEHETIVVNEAFLGRDKDCIVRYGDEHPSVSRKHAVLRWQSGVVVLHHISNTNSTFVNDQEVFGERPLQNGDVIKLSVDGPRLRFNIAEAGQGVKSMRISQRLSLFAQQGLRPYRTALYIMGALLLLSTSAGAYYFMKTNDQLEVISEKQKEIDVLGSKVNMAEKELNDLVSKGNADDAKVNELRNRISNYQSNMGNLRNDLNRLRANAGKTTETRTGYDSDNTSTTSPSQKSSSDVNGSQATSNQGNATQTNSSGEASNYDGNLEFLENDVYYIGVEKVEIVNTKGVVSEVKFEQEFEAWGGTGFVTTENDFITARHVIQPWKYFSPKGEGDKCSLIHILAICDFNSIDFTVYFKAVSKNGKSYTFTNKEFSVDPSKDVIQKTEQTLFDCDKVVRELSKGIFRNDPRKYKQYKSCDRTYTDWAKLQRRDIKTNLVPDRDIVPKKGETMYCLGYPLLGKIQNVGTLEPLFSTMTTSQGGAKNQITNVSGHSFTPGYSGSPVFVKRDGKYICVGIVSAKSDGIGFVVPYANVQ